MLKLLYVNFNKSIMERRFGFMLKIAKRFWKEIVAVLGGIGFAYCWQLCLLFLLESRELADFIPILTIQLTIVPIVAWCLMGALHVRWIKSWLRVTAVLFGIAIPFCLIAGISIIVAPAMWGKMSFWVITCLITAVIAILLIPKLLRTLPRR